MLEVVLAGLGGLFAFAKVVSVIKAILFAEDIMKKVTFNEREEFIKGHVFENHNSKLKYCTTNQCASF